MFQKWNMVRYRRATTEEFPECMEVYPDETPLKAWRFVGSIIMSNSGSTVLPRKILIGVFAKHV